MSYLKRTALVVDDEALVRNLTIRALQREGFTCDVAHDGVEAKELLDRNQYDVVTTDLVMPNRHGHSLAVEVLAGSDPPLVVVLTGVLEPRLVKDLIARGVASVEFKPVNYDLFAAKTKALVVRREAERACTQTESRTIPSHAQSKSNGSGIATGKTETQAETLDLEHDLQRLSKMLPVSQAALDVFNMVSSNAFDTHQIAAAIKRDPSLTADVLRLANCSLYNTSDTKIVELEQAVVRIGQRRIGELALAISTLATLTGNVLPWMNINVAWRRSMAAGVAVELLLERGGYTKIDEALFLSAIMNSLGRIALGMLYPQRYQEMIKTCETKNGLLVEEEKRVFGMTHGQVMAQLLEAWGIPNEVFEPLQYVTDSYASLAALREPLRTKAELLKLAVLFGRIAVGRWELWDLVELPPATVLQRLNVKSFSDIVEQTRSDLEAIATMRMPGSAAKKHSQTPVRPQPPCSPIPYCNLSGRPFDFLAEIIPSTGTQLNVCDTDVFESEEKVIINCIWTPPHRLTAHVNGEFSKRTRLILTDAAQAELYSRFGRVVSLPGSYGDLREACQEIGQPVPGLSPGRTTGPADESSIDAKG
jgi:HD-like signal output (HDOD) protein/FixJ family two-component response regulator